MEPVQLAAVLATAVVLASMLSVEVTHYARAHAHDLIVIGHRGHFLGD